MSAPEETGVSSDVVATRQIILSGIVGLDSVLTVRADGTLHLDRIGGEGETRTVPPENVRPLIEALAKPEWQEVEDHYGVAVPDGYTIVVEGGGKQTSVAIPSEITEPTPPVLDEVLALLEGLWPVEDNM